MTTTTTPCGLNIERVIFTNIVTGDKLASAVYYVAESTESAEWANDPPQGWCGALVSEGFSCDDCPLAQVGRAEDEGKKAVIVLYPGAEDVLQGFPFREGQFVTPDHFADIADVVVVDLAEASDLTTDQEAFFNNSPDVWGYDVWGIGYDYEWAVKA